MSRVGCSMRANSGIHLAMGSSSRSFKTASAVKLLVIEAMRKTFASASYSRKSWSMAGRISFVGGQDRGGV